MGMVIWIEIEIEIERGKEEEEEEEEEGERLIERIEVLRVQGHTLHGWGHWAIPEMSPG